MTETSVQVTNYLQQPTEIAALITIAGVLLTVVIFFLDSLYVRKKALRIQREADVEKATKEKEGYETQIQDMNDKLEAAKRVVDALSSGPIAQLTQAVTSMQRAVDRLNDSADHRQERFMEVVTGLDKRLTYIEARQPPR